MMVGGDGDDPKTIKIQTWGKKLRDGNVDDTDEEEEVYEEN